MSNRTIQTAQLTPGAIFMVRGTLGYSRLASQITGEELQKDIQRRRSNSWIPIERPYTTATIHNAVVQYAQEGVRRPEEIYAEESLYTSRSQYSQGGFCFTGVNKGNSCPYIAQMQPDGKTVEQVIPEGELAAGQDVTLVMRVFKGKPNNGVTLDGVIVNGPIRYFDNAQAGQGLEQMGLVFHRADPAPAKEADTSDDGVDMPVDEGNPFAAQPQEPVYNQPQFNQGYGQPAQQGGIRYNPANRGY